MEQKMFCYQCQETAGCKGCTMSGVCGKKPDVAAMQDLSMSQKEFRLLRLHCVRKVSRYLPKSIT